MDSADHAPLQAILTDALAGRYAVERVLGQGGMATVFLADDMRLGRKVALKVFGSRGHGLHYNPARFLREIRIAARLTHPHIVPVHDSGEIPGAGGPLLYYVMPYVQGESLRERLARDGRLEVAEVLRIARSVGDALDYAWRQGVLHRDVKPENVMLLEGDALVTDFGVAVALREGDQAGGSTTAPGVAVGTPFYMSPEQAAGERDLDGRSDQYALACVIHEMLAGQPPFTGLARAVMSRHIVEPPPAIRAVRPDVSVAVERALLRALAKEPVERFASAAELLQAMATPDGSTSVANPTRLRTVAVLPFVNATGDPATEYFSDGMTDDLIGALANVEGLRVAARASVYALKGRRDDVRSTGALLNVGAALEGTVRKAGGRLRVTAQLSDTADGRVLWAGRFDKEEGDVFAIQDEIVATIVRTLSGQLLGEIGSPVPRRYTDNVRAYNLYLQGRFAWNKRSEEGMREAIASFEAAIREDADYALAWSGLADAYAIGVDYRTEPVEIGFGRAKELARKALSLDDSLAEAHTSLAWVTFIHDWDWDAAARSFERAIAANPRYPSARQWYAWLLASQGRLAEAVREGQLAAELDPVSVSVRRGVGSLYFYARDWAQAAQQLRRTLAMNPVSTETMMALAQALLFGGSAAEAEAVVRDGLLLAPEDTSLLAAMGRIHVARDRTPEARAIARHMEALRERRYVSPTDQAKLALALGDHDDAFAHVERCLVERRGWVAYCRVDPLWDPVRGDPRFSALLQRMRLG